MTAVVARDLFKVGAGVVHALMQAQYQNSNRGQFISQDPVFLGDPKQQALPDPQSVDGYAYLFPTVFNFPDKEYELTLLPNTTFVLDRMSG